MKAFSYCSQKSRHKKSSIKVLCPNPVQPLLGNVATFVSIENRLSFLENRNCIVTLVEEKVSPCAGQVNTPTSKFCY